MGQYDITIKSVLQDGGRGLLRQLHVPETRALPTEMNVAREWRADFLGEADDGRIYHVEIQTAFDPVMATRMLEYNARVRRALEDRAKKEGRPRPIDVEIVQTVLNVADERWGLVQGIVATGLRFTYDVVNAIDLDPEPLLLDGDASDAVFVLLCRDGTNPGTIRRALERILSETGASRQDALARMLVIAKLRNASQLVQRQIDDMSITIDVADIPILREPIDRAAREGLEQGIEQGRSAGMADLFVAQLTTAFGELPDEIVARIGELPTDHLMELAIDIGDIDSMERLRESLDLPVDAVPSTVPKP